MSKNYPISELEKKAWKFAHDAHHGVERKFSGVPYFFHVRQVFKLVKKVDPSSELGAASLLHDTVEDVEEVTYEVILKEFGKRVADLVNELTSDKEKVEEMGKADYLSDKMIKMTNDALVIKLCDRYQNLSDHFTATTKFRRKYYSETKYIIEKLKKERNLNRKQIIVTDWIEGLLRMMENRYKVHTFESFTISHLL
jgi:(p)ppGpp synthase/HD superfamily hydrolase